MELVSVQELRADARSLAEWANGTGELHGAYELRLRWLEGVLVWLTAITAGLGGLSLFGDNQTATLILSVTTVVLAGTNAAYKPSERAAAHATARAAFFEVADKVSIFATYKVPPREEVAEEAFASLRDEFTSLMTMKTTAMKTSPYIPPVLFYMPHDQSAAE